MKQMKKLSALAAGSMTIALLLGTSLVQAEEVCVDGDTVIGIKGLDVVTKTYGATTMDVDFTYATGYEVYGSNLDLPWDQAFSEDDPFSVMGSINNTLSAENPVPDYAGQSGQNIYYIASEEETQGPGGLIGAFGGENLTGEKWDVCDEESANECAVGVAILQADQRFTYAALSKAVTGASCNGGAPPDPDEPPTTSYNIVPCITGSWYLKARDGEGYNIEIIGQELDPQLLAYFYTYDDAGNQMWLVGQGPANGDTAVVPVQVTSGPVYGDLYDKADLDREDWGTLTFTFTSKNTGIVERDSIDFGKTTFDIDRLTSVTGLECP
jgi:hypothetical protein